MFLTNLHVVLSKEYEGEGTANSVGMELVQSLGIRREDVANIFHHAVYDGVYATAEERAHGRGCISLTRHMAEWCDVDEDYFTARLCTMTIKDIKSWLG